VAEVISHNETDFAKIGKENGARANILSLE